MDRNARTISMAALLFLVVVAVYMTVNPPGIPLTAHHDDRESTSEMVAGPLPTVDPHRRAGVLPDPGRSMEKPDAERLASHLEKLLGAQGRITRADLPTVNGSTAYRAVVQLRPYWVSDTLGANVRVGGQLLGSVHTLRNIPLSLVDEFRLEFSVTEPHWIIQVFLR